MAVLETYPARDLGVASQALGINLGSYWQQEWAYTEAKRAGCREVRWHHGWAAVEPFATPGVYNMASIDTALGFCTKYGLEPLLVAAYAPAYSLVRTITVNGAHPAGTTQLTVTGNVSDLQMGRDHLAGSGIGKASYYGGIIHSASGQVLTLGAATTLALAHGAVLSINRLLYPSITGTDPQAPSAQAFANYVEALANRIAAAGLQGAVEVWNEPPWPNDAWDDRSRFYDNPTAMGVTPLVRLLTPLLAAVAGRTFPAGVRAVSSSAHKSGFHGLLATLPPSALGPFVADSIHPYGFHPEIHWWHTSGAGVNWGAGYVGLIAGGTSNVPYLAKQHADNPSAALELRITETGRTGESAEDRMIGNLRHFVSALAMGISRVIFYSLGDDPFYRMMDPVTKERTPGWLALTHLVQFLKRVQADASNYSLPTINSAELGAWNLAVIRLGPVLVMYQRTVMVGSDYPTIHPVPVSVTLTPDSGTLLRLESDGTTQPINGDVIEVGARPVVVTRRVD